MPAQDQHPLQSPNPDLERRVDELMTLFRKLPPKDQRRAIRLMQTLVRVRRRVRRKRQHGGRR